MTTILGINHAYHESSACLINDGIMVAAAEEERFTRVKHGKEARVDNPHELPLQAMNYCRERAGIPLDEIDYVVSSFNPRRRFSSRNPEKKLEKNPEPTFDGQWGSASGETLFYQNLQRVPRYLSERWGMDGSSRAGRSRFSWINHHDAHAGSAFFVSPFDSAAVLVIDGIGEQESTSGYEGEGNTLQKKWSIPYPHSIGFLWEKIAKFLGFSEYDAGTVMALASYGDSERDYAKFKQFITINGDNDHERCFHIDPDVVQFRVEDYTGLERILGNRRISEEALEDRHADIAAGLQRVTEEIVLSLGAKLYRETKKKKLCMAGGVALNCVANAVLLEKGPFTDIYIQPAAHDAGTAIGSAYYLWHQRLGNPRSFVMIHPYYGPEYSQENLKNALDSQGLHYRYHSTIEKEVARLIAEGNIVGWFQGAMEIGPRALGNRSILADPRNPKMQDILNSKVKHREPFRPFCPSVLEGKAEEWFRIPRASVSSDFMLFAYPVREQKRSSIPAVVHIDGTSRIQTVREETNPRYHRLIKEFEALTAVPLVINTSFNDNEPIVCSPEDAVQTFLKTSIDYLAVGNFLVSRAENHDHE